MADTSSVIDPRCASRTSSASVAPQTPASTLTRPRPACKDSPRAATHKRPPLTLRRARPALAPPPTAPPSTTPAQLEERRPTGGAFFVPPSAARERLGTVGRGGTPTQAVRPPV